MELVRAIQDRRSIRGFQKRPVSQDVLKKVLELATRAVSSNNIQPWEFVVVSGEALDTLRKANLDDLRAQRSEDFPNRLLEGVYLQRARDVGKQLFASMQIERTDKERRAWWGERGYAFFDAPAAILLCMDRSLDESEYRFDFGCVTQNICLAALEFGLGTCVENQAITYQRGLRELLHIPETKRFVCGIAIGYPDGDFPANQVISSREEVDRQTLWYGFPDTTPIKSSGQA